MLSVDELSGTPDAGLTLVSRNADRIMDCKDNEREAISTMLALLFVKGKLSKDDVGNGMAEAVEFIDSFVIDSPKAYDYLGDLLSALFNAKALTIAWLCEQCEKLEAADTPEKVVRKTMEAMKNKFGPAAVKECFGGADASLKLAALLGEDKWNAIAGEMMA